jgi:hypothetical protein
LHVERLAGAGLIARGYDREGSVVAITAAGRRRVGADKGDVRSGATHGSGLRHARASRGWRRCCTSVGRWQSFSPVATGVAVGEDVGVGEGVAVAVGAGGTGGAAVGLGVGVPVALLHGQGSDSQATPS